MTHSHGSQYRSILVFLTLFSFLLISKPISTQAVLVDSFDGPNSEAVLKRGDFVGGGKNGARVPFVTSEFVEDESRGKVMKISFNVSEGFGGSYLVFRKGKIPTDFNTVRFWIRGTVSAFKVELKDDFVYSFVIEKRKDMDWREIVIPITSFSNYKKLVPKDIKEFIIVFEDHRTSPRLGAVFMDDFSFTKEQREELTPLKQAQPSWVFINGKRQRGQMFQTKETPRLSLSSKSPRKAVFEWLRFEASRDGKHWFYLNEVPNQGKQEFAFSWEIKSYQSGTYWLRAVLVNQFGDYVAGRASEIWIENNFNFEIFLDEVQKRTFEYFFNEVDPKTFLVKDRNKKASNFSTGLSGFQWAAYVIAIERGWMKKEEALKRLHASLDFLLKVRRREGLLSHWFSPELKEVWENGEGDLVETSYVLAGALTAQSYFEGNTPSEVSLREKIDQFTNEVQWNIILKREKKEDEKGLLPWRWSEKKGASKLEIQGYNEAMITYLLALGAPKEYAIPIESWHAWAKTYQKGKYGPYELIACAPLFTHQYSHLWIDFLEIQDRYANYFENSILATLANREYSLKENGYTPEIWGLTASEGPGGYKAYGAPPLVSLVPVANDGTIAPTAAGGSVMFTPALAIAALKDIRENYGERVWGQYGFKDALNPKRKWFSNEYLGLDEGPILISIENYRT
ncbi:MAG: hypothetical protein HY582_04095, partial [Candidatus Omnitrophica bacterium]|nr:hypothetical protein [Candidatus Omnitrophota bacterium]